MTQTYTREQAVERMEQLHARITEIAGKHRTSRADDQEFADAQVEFADLERQVETLDRSAAIARAAGGGYGELRIERGSIQPYTTSHTTVSSATRDAAMRTLERSVKAGLPARSAEVVEGLVDSGPEASRSWVQRWVTETGAPEYRSAFAQLLLHGEARAALQWSPAERESFERVTRLAAEQRAMGEGSGPAGSYLVPWELDPTVILTSGGSTNPLMQIARVVASYSNSWHGVSSAGVVAEWLDEAAEASDASPTLAEPTVPNHKLSVFVPFSVELAGDAVDLMGQLGRLMSDGAAQLLNAALTTGSGVKQPTGIVTALAGAPASVIAAETGGTVTSADVYRTQNQLPPRFQANARWAGNLSILNALRQFETQNGALRFPSLQTDPPTLLGRPVHELSNMDNTIAAGSNVLLYGDFSDGFVISQRVGSSVELIPQVFGENRRPTGQRGVWLWARYGSDVVNANAFRLLQL